MPWENIRQRFNTDTLRSLVFGVEDSLVSTIGLVSGIAVAGVPKITLLLTGTILILVEAFSMSVGSLLSSNSAEEFKLQHSVPLRASFLATLVMFVAYLVSGFFVLAPYLWLPYDQALYTSVALSLILLFLLGYGSARLSGAGPLRKAFIMMLIGGMAIALGILVGVFFKIV